MPRTLRARKPGVREHPVHRRAAVADRVDLAQRAARSARGAQSEARMREVARRTRAAIRAAAATSSSMPAAGLRHQTQQCRGRRSRAARRRARRPRKPVAPVSRIAARVAQVAWLAATRARRPDVCPATRASANICSNGSSRTARLDAFARRAGRRACALGASGKDVGRQLASELRFERRRELDRRQRIEPEQVEGVSASIGTSGRRQRAATAVIVGSSCRS